MLARHAISDANWDRIKDLLPGREGQTGWIAEDNRRFIDGVLWIAKTRKTAVRLSPESAQDAVDVEQVRLAGWGVARNPFLDRGF